MQPMNNFRTPNQGIFEEQHEICKYAAVTIFFRLLIREKEKRYNGEVSVRAQPTQKMSLHSGLHSAMVRNYSFIENLYWLGKKNIGRIEEVISDYELEIQVFFLFTMQVASALFACILFH